MSERTPPRKPQTFRLDDPGVVVVDAEDAARASRGTIQITPEADPAQLPVPIETRLPERRGFRWGAVFWGGVAGLVLLGLGLGVTQLIDDLFARSESLGVLGLAFAIAAALGLGVVTAREVFALMRLATIEKLHARAASRGRWSWEANVSRLLELRCTVVAKQAGALTINMRHYNMAVNSNRGGILSLRLVSNGGASLLEPEETKTD